MKIKRFIFIYILFNLISFSFARPKIALVLSGGGAKGLAEIPIIEALEEEGIVPDMILGTSMGAIIGSFYAAGYSPKQIREIVLSMNYLKIFGESPVTLERVPPEVFSSRGDSDIALSFSVNNKTLGSAPGFIGDQNIVMELTNRLSKVLTIKDFDKLKIPFRCVATNASSGEPIVLKSGSIVDAVRASISVPEVFTPAPLENGIYAMDGGIKDNLPIRAAKEMGADIIIAIDVASNIAPDPASLSDFVNVTEHIITLIISSPSVEQYHLATVVLKPDLKDFGTADFFHPKEIVQAGENYAKENKDKIHEIAVSISKQGYSLLDLDYNRVSDYDKMKDLKINKVFIKDISFCKNASLPKVREFKKYEGKVLDRKTKEKLTADLKEKKNQYHLANLTYCVEEIDGSDKCNILLRANYYEQELSKIFFTTTPSISFTNLSTHKYATINPFTSMGIYLESPIDTVFRFSTGSIIQSDLIFYPELFSNKGFKVSGELGGTFKYGSLEPKNYFFFSERVDDSDRGFIGNVGLRFKYIDMIIFRFGLAYEADYVNSKTEWYKNSFIYNDIVWTTLYNNLIKLRGFQFEALSYLGKNYQLYDENEIGYILRCAYEHRFEVVNEKTSIGFGLLFCKNRFPYELNIGYNDYGGIKGMCGYPQGMLKRDFQIAEISLRQKIFTFVGLPVYLIVQGKAGIADEYNPFYDENEPNSKFLGENKSIEAGAASYVALSTPIGNLILGYSINTDNKWVITFGLK